MAKPPPSVTINLSGANSSTLQALAGFDGVQINGDKVIILPSVVRRGDPASYLAFHNQLQQLVGGDLPRNIEVLGSEMERRAWPGVYVGNTGVRVASGLTTARVNGPAGTQIERPLLVIEVTGIRKDAFSIRGTADSIRHYFQIEYSPQGPILTELHHPHRWESTIPPNQTGRFDVALRNRDLQAQGYELIVSLERDETGLLKVAQAHIGGKTKDNVPWAEAIRPSYKPPRRASYSHAPASQGGRSIVDEIWMNPEHRRSAPRAPIREAARGGSSGRSIVDLLWQDPEPPQGRSTLPDALRIKLSAKDKRYLQPHLDSDRLHLLHSESIPQNDGSWLSAYRLEGGNGEIVCEITRAPGKPPQARVKYLEVGMHGVKVVPIANSALHNIDLTDARWIGEPLGLGTHTLVYYGDGIIETGVGHELPLATWAGKVGKGIDPRYQGGVMHEAVHAERFLRTLNGEPPTLREVSGGVAGLYRKIEEYVSRYQLNRCETAGLVAAVDERLGLPDPTKTQLLRVVQAGISDSRLEPFFRFLSRFHRGSYLSVELAQAGITGILGLGALFAVGALAQSLSPSSQNNGEEGLSATTTVLSTIASSFGRRWAVLFSGGAAAVDYFDNGQFDTSALDYAFMVA